MALKPQKVVRIRIIGSESVREKVVATLHRFGVMQIEQADPSVAAEMQVSSRSEELEKFSSKLQLFRSYESILPAVPVKGKATFSSPDDILEQASKIDIGDALKELKSKEEDLETDIKEIERRIEAVVGLQGINQDISIFNSSRIKSYVVMGEIIDVDLLKKELVDCSIIKSGDNYIISIRKDLDKELARLASSGKFTLIHIPEVSGKPEDYLHDLQAMMEEKRKLLHEVRDELLKISNVYYERIVQIREALEIETSRLETSEKLPRLRDAFALEGWITVRNLDRMRPILEKTSQGKIIISTVKTSDMPPTVLSNFHSIKFFEFFIRFYSLPLESEFDPTLIFAIVFPFFFGLMVGDFGYGIVILLFSIWLKNRLERPRKRSRLPKGLTSFVTRIFGTGPLIVLSKTLIIGSVVAIVAGIIFNDFFGFKVLPFTVYNVIDNVPKLLLLSGYIGISMVSFGLILGAIDQYRMDHMRGMGAKIGWLILAISLTIFGLDVIHASYSISFYTSLAFMMIGGITVVVMEGVTAGVEIPSLLSHILSYTRIVGILLASVALADVIDYIFVKGIRISPVDAVVAVIILVLGQIFNLIIVIFEPGIQGARLIYVEFFSKFYHGGGKPFRPFRVVRKYTSEPLDDGNGGIHT